MKFDKWVIPRAIIEETERAFQAKKSEVFVMWNAQLLAAGTLCSVCRAVIPEQESGFAPGGGAYVHISGEELARIQFDNYDHEEWSVIQLHTHPGADVNMSPLDRKWEVVAHVGALSIIVPFFGERGLRDFSGVNVYEREEKDWRLWSDDETLRRIEVL